MRVSIFSFARMLATWLRAVRETGANKSTTLAATAPAGFTAPPS
ncbi:MAG: hypothetical protein WKF96_11270 [Solirubrobacteraceae bacterium]